MLKQLTQSVLPALCGICLSMAPAYGDIGGIGSPVEISNPPPASDAAASADNTQPLTGEAPANVNTAPPNVAPVNNATASAANNAPPPLPNQVSGDKKLQLVLNLNFTRELKQYDQDVRNAVAATESTRPGATYYVISYVPSGSQNVSESAAREINANMANVLDVMEHFGIDKSRIQTSSDISPTHQQQIRIYIY